MGGLILCQGIASVPFVFLLLGAAMRTMNPALEEASSASGARPLTTFFRVTLPVLRPGVLAPLILATLVALEQFEMPLIIGFPARINVFSTRLYFDLNPEDELPAYGKAAAVGPAVPGRRRRAADGLQPPDPARRALRDGDRQGLSADPLRARPLARCRRCCSSASICGRRDPAGHRAGVDELLRRQQRRARASMPTARCSPTGASGRRSATPSSSPGLSAGIITLIGALLAWQILRLRFPGRAAARRRELHVDRHSGGDHRLCGHGAASHHPDRPLRHGLDPGARLFLSPRRLDPALARVADADPSGARGSLRRLGRPLARHDRPGGPAAARRRR